MRRKLDISLAIAGLLSVSMACSPQPAEVADTVYTNGRIYTVDEAQPWAEAVAIKDGKFLVVGSAADVEAVTGEGTEVVDLGGKFVMPGMIDVHTHGVDAHLPSAIQLSDSSDLDLILSEIKAHVEAHSERDAFHFATFGFGLFPGDNGPKELLDEISKDKAIAVEHQSGHAFWANSRALELAGITKDTPDPPQGIIARKPNGEPAGGLQEEAMRPIRKILPPIPDEAIIQSAEAAMGIFAAHGITATREAGTIPARYAVMQRLENEGRLKTRFSFAAHWQTTLIDVPPSNDEVRAWLLDNTGKHSDVLKLDALKVYMDGVPASRTAAVKEAYLGEPDNFGMTLIAGEELDAAIVDYDANGVALIMHVLGDQATRQGLDAIAAARTANGDSELRHHLSHSIIIDPADFDAYAELGAVVDFSPFFAYQGPVHNNHVEALGAERVDHWYPVKSLMDRGVVVALATDYPVDQINPFVHIESAHTRRHPLGEAEGTLGADEAITREQAIEAYTLNPAYILGWDDIIGSIEVGKYADMVVLDRNPLEIPAEEISDTKVMTTLFAGEVVHQSGDLTASAATTEEMRFAALARLEAEGHPCATHG
jgi:predicted amidohydrolase YtcJ